MGIPYSELVKPLRKKLTQRCLSDSRKIMAETGTMRVVPSGKIYRQMFEAQVLLESFHFTVCC